jgi:hypothetical protein
MAMRRLSTLLIAILAVAAQALAVNSVEKFRYQPDKITIGTVYHYVKTNIDGTHPEYVSQYVATRDRLEVFKFHPKGDRAALVIADFDWTVFSAKRLESWQVVAGLEKKLFATLSYLDAEKAVQVSILPLRKTEKTAIKVLPFHVYNFDFGSLNFAFRHLINHKGSFVIGIADPTFKVQGPLFTYRGEVVVSYLNDEVRYGVRCRKYRVDGQGLEKRGGYIWLNQTEGYIQDMEIDLPDNPEWQSFKFKLLRVEQMNRQEWESFMKKQF